MSDSNPLWQEVYAALKGHQSPPRDPTPQATLDRIAAKCHRLTFNPNNCDIHEEFLSLEELKRLKRYSEDDDRPNIEVEPIVVLVYGELRLVINGRRRLTKWLNEGIDKLRHALIITPRQ